MSCSVCMRLTPEGSNLCRNEHHKQSDPGGVARSRRPESTDNNPRKPLRPLQGRIHRRICILHSCDPSGVRSVSGLTLHHAASPVGAEANRNIPPATFSPVGATEKTNRRRLICRGCARARLLRRRLIPDTCYPKHPNDHSQCIISPRSPPISQYPIKQLN